MLMGSSRYTAAPSVALCHAVVRRGHLCARPLLCAVDAVQGGSGACQPRRAAGLAQLWAQRHGVEAGGLADPCWRTFPGHTGEVKENRPAWKAGLRCVLSLRNSLPARECKTTFFSAIFTAEAFALCIFFGQGSVYHCHCKDLAQVNPKYMRKPGERAGLIHCSDSLSADGCMHLSAAC